MRYAIDTDTSGTCSMLCKLFFIIINNMTESNEVVSSFLCSSML